VKFGNENVHIFLEKVKKTTRDTGSWPDPINLATMKWKRADTNIITIVPVPEFCPLKK
jgi:hypothetical protein